MDEETEKRFDRIDKDILHIYETARKSMQFIVVVLGFICVALVCHR